MAKTYIPFGKGSLQLTEIVANSGQYGLDVNVVSGGGSGDLSTAVILAPASSTRNTVQPSGAFTNLVLKQSASGTPDLLTLTNTSDAVLARFNRTGYLGIGVAPGTNHIALESATDDPVIQFESKTNPGSAVAPFLKILNGVGAERLRFTYDQGQVRFNIGIGTSPGTVAFSFVNGGLFGIGITPSVALHVQQTASSVAAIIRQTGTSPGDYLQLQTAGGSPVTVFNNSGRLGIGVTTVLPALDVQLGVTAASAVANGARFQQTLTAAANNDVLRGMYINPTFTAGAFTGLTRRSVQIDAGDAASVPLVLKLAASPTVNGFEMRSNSDSIILSFDSSGTVVATDYKVTGSTRRYYDFNQTSYVLASGVSPNNLMIAGNAAHIPLVVRGAASQSADIFQVQNSSSTALFAVTPDGRTNLSPQHNNASTTSNAVQLITKANGVTPAAGFGAAWKFFADTNGGTNRAQVDVLAAWESATDASRTSRLIVNVYEAANVQEFVRVIGDSGGIKFAFGGATPLARPDYTTLTGTANRNAGGLDTATVTTAQLAEVVKAMISDLISVGLWT